eukprot:g37815.t1
MPNTFGKVQALDYWPQDDLRLFKEVGSAWTASVLVSPLVTIIDKSIVKDIEGLASLSRAMASAFTKMIFQPKAFFGGAPFLYTCGVYFGTYTAANCTEMMVDYFRVAETEKRKTTKVAFATAANVSLLAWRDAQFAKMFVDGPKKPAVPKISYGLFMVRDAATMMATFYGAPTMAKYLQVNHDWSKDTAELSMALSIPIVTQFATAPIHTYAFDKVSRPGALGFTERLTKIFEEMPKVCFARGLRILPAFGIGSYTNNKLREYFIKRNAGTCEKLAAEYEKENFDQQGGLKSIEVART